MFDDYTADTGTTGTVEVGGSATGELESGGDRDWFAVELVAGRTYTIDLRGSGTNDGTLGDPYLRGIHDADGNLVSGTANDDGGAGFNSRVTFTAGESGTYYIAAGAYGSGQGTYVVEVTDTAADGAPDGARDLGDITDLAGPRFPDASLDGGGDRIDYFRFTLSEAKTVGLGLRQQDADADLFLEDAEGNVLASSTADGTANEAITETLLAGTYYVRVEAQEEGSNDFKLRYGVEAPDPDEVARLERQQQGGTNEAPAFAESGYAFDLAENADGSTNRVALGTVSAADPEDAALTYSIEGGNAAGLFEIDASTGALSYKGTGEDYESGTTSYELTVRASDGGLHSDVTVTVNITDVDEQVDADAAREGATDLGDITALEEAQFPRHSLDGEGDRVDYFRFTLSEAKTVGLGLRRQDANADLYLEDEDGNVLYSSTASGTANEWVSATLLAGTYYVRVEAKEAGENAYVFRYGVSEADAEEVERLQTPPASVGVADAEGHESEDGVIRFLVSLDRAASTPVTVRYETVDGTALAGDDYEAVSGELTFAAGETEQWVEVTLVDDTVEDSGETFTLRLSGPTGAVLGDAEAVGTILDTEPPPTTVSEPSGSDFAADTGTAGRVVAGDPATGEIATGGDVDWFALDLEAGTTYRIDLLGSYMGGGTLLDPYIRGIHDSEGNLLPGTGNNDRMAGFYLSSRVDFTPETDGTYYVAAGANGDGTGTYTVSVTRYADDHAASTRTTGEVAVDGSATGEIERQNDRDWFAVELEAGTTYRIDLEGRSTGQGTLDRPLLHGIHDSNGGLLPGTYDRGSGEGRNSRVAFTPETDGTYYIAASAAWSETGTYRVSVKPAVWEIEVSDAEAHEADGTMRFRVSLDWAAVTPVTVRYETVDGTAMAGADYRAASGTLTFAKGETTKWVEVTLFDDRLEDNGETFTLRLSDASPGAILADVEAVGTIRNVEDPTQSVSEPEGTDLPAGTATSGQIAVDGSATGRIQVETDRDWFAVTLEAGTTYRIEMRGADVQWRNRSWHDNEVIFVDVGHGNLRDPYLRGIYDSDGNLVPGTTNNNSWNTFDSLVMFTPTESGTYFVEAAVPEINVNTGTYTLYVADATDDYASTTDTTGVVPVGGSTRGELEINTDRDWFGVTLVAGRTYQFDVEGASRGHGTLFSPFLEGLYDEDGNRIDGASGYQLNPNYRSMGNSGYVSDGSRDSRMVFTPSEDATYYVAIKNFGWSDHRGRGTYKVSVNEVTDDFAAWTTTTGTVTVGGSATGKVDVMGDRDWFAVTLEADTTYRIELDKPVADALSGFPLDVPVLHGIHDENGNRFPGTTDYYADLRTGSDQRPAIMMFTATESGTYYIAAGSIVSSIMGYPPGTTPRVGTGSYMLSVTEVTDDYQDTTDTTGVVTVGGSVRGEIDTPHDRDWFAAMLEAGTTYRVELNGMRFVSQEAGFLDQGHGDLRDPFLRGIHDSDGTLLPGTSNDNRQDSLNSLVMFTPTESGTYYISASGASYHLGTYTLSVEEVI